MTWTILSTLVGLAVGWQAGRLYQHARVRYGMWRGAVAAVPVAYRAAVDAAKQAAKYISVVVVVGAIILFIAWKTH